MDEYGDYHVGNPEKAVEELVKGVNSIRAKQLMDTRGFTYQQTHPNLLSREQAEQIIGVHQKGYTTTKAGTYYENPYYEGPGSYEKTVQDEVEENDNESEE